MNVQNTTRNTRRLECSIEESSTAPTPAGCDSPPRCGPEAGSASPETPLPPSPGQEISSVMLDSLVTLVENLTTLIGSLLSTIFEKLVERQVEPPASEPTPQSPAGPVTTSTSPSTSTPPTTSTPTTSTPGTTQAGTLPHAAESGEKKLRALKHRVGFQWNPTGRGARMTLPSNFKPSEVASVELFDSKGASVGTLRAGTGASKSEYRIDANDRLLAKGMKLIFTFTDGRRRSLELDDAKKPVAITENATSTKKS